MRHQAVHREVCLVEPCIAQSGRTQVCLTEVGSGEQGGIELSTTEVSFNQAGVLQYCVGHQRELHLGLGEAGVLETGRNKVRPT